ncbi:MAG: signal recognition particle protein, partial [Acidobacteria bacterium]|nr:signal recognition particle protein [Acidobacteriota bacterium]
VETLFVADAMTGQDAVRSAETYHQRLALTGVILTKLDGDARGGAALSIRGVTGQPIKFIGVGEKYEQLEVFHPDRIVSRILGMGDVLSLIERAEEVVERKQAEVLEEKLRKAEFTFEDFREQLGALRRMGPLDQVLAMIPGASQLPGVEADERKLVHLEAIIDSMTPRERRRPDIIDGKRRRRIARGSGTSVQQVNQLLRQFAAMRRMMKTMKGGKGATSALARRLGLSRLP